MCLHANELKTLQIYTFFNIFFTILINGSKETQSNCFSLRDNDLNKGVLIQIGIAITFRIQILLLSSDIL